MVLLMYCSVSGIRFFILYMYDYYGNIRTLRKDLECIRRIGRTVLKSFAEIQKTSGPSTHERTHNIHDC